MLFPDSGGGGGAGGHCTVRTISEYPEQAFGMEEAMKAACRQSAAGAQGRVPYVTPQSGAVLWE